METYPVQKFVFDENEVRILIDEKGELWFIAADVCKSLGLENPTRAVERLDSDETALTTIQGGPNQYNIVNESGLYSLILTSRKPEAKRFRKWVTSEVLPAIRKTGSYSQKQPATLVEMFALQAQINLDFYTRLEAIETIQRQGIETLKALPEPTTQAPEKSLRAALNECLRSFVHKTGVSHAEVWNKLYRELKYRTSFDVLTRAKHSKRSPLDLVEEAGLLPELYAIAREVLK